MNLLARAYPKKHQEDFTIHLSGGSQHAGNIQTRGKKKSVLPISGLLFYRALMQYCGSHNRSSTQQLTVVLLCPHDRTHPSSRHCRASPTTSILHPGPSKLPLPPLSPGQSITQPAALLGPLLQRPDPTKSSGLCLPHQLKLCWFYHPLQAPKNSLGTTQHRRGTAQRPSPGERSRLRHGTQPVPRLINSPEHSGTNNSISALALLISTGPT